MVATPLAVVVHSLGALWGLLRPVNTFHVTEKVSPATIESVHERLEEDALSEHDGTGRLFREREDQYQMSVFDD